MLRFEALSGPAHAAWPTVELSDAEFAVHLASLLGGAPDVAEALGAMRGPDVYLAAACSFGDAEAHRIFEEQFVRAARVVIARERDVVEPEEFFQRLRERLLVAGADRPARIARYSGKGKLLNWVRIAAQRLLIDEYRKRDAAPTEVGSESLDPLRAAGADPEIDVLKSTYREGFQEAFESAFTKLTDRERTLLRYRYVDGLEVNQIASISGRHRVSVYRALVKARESLLEHLRRDVALRMRLRGSEAESVFRLMQSQLDVRLSRLLSPES